MSPIQSSLFPDWPVLIDMWPVFRSKKESILIFKFLFLITEIMFTSHFLTNTLHSSCSPDFSFNFRFA